MFCSSKPKRHIHTKINQEVKLYIYGQILQHPQVVVSPIANDCLKLSIDGQVQPQLKPKLLLQVSFREPHNSMVSTPEEGGIKQEIDADNNTIISDSTLRNILPPQLNNMTSQFKVMGNYECCIYAKIMNYLSQNAQNRRSGEISSHILKPIIMQYDLMVVIFTTPLKTRPWKNVYLYLWKLWAIKLERCVTLL